jgi:phosphoglycolate phosphatase
MSIKEGNLIFDLDGTLFDSAPEIIDCLNEIFKKNNIKVKNNFDQSIIGPPLKDILKSIIQKKDISKIDVLMSEFIKLYDSKYCYKSRLYKSVRETLEILKRKKRLFLITNKRLAPTKIMLENKEIIQFFENYFCVDVNDVKKKDKNTLIANTLVDLNINPKDTVYIGDTKGDFFASHNNDIKFIFAEWGYGGNIDSPYLNLNDISELV